MAGLLRPYEAEALIRAIKAEVALPLALHCHATTGLSLATHMKAIEAGIDILDTAISITEHDLWPFAHRNRGSHAGRERACHQAGFGVAGRDRRLLFARCARSTLAFEGEMRGVDSRILLAQVLAVAC